MKRLSCTGCNRGHSLGYLFDNPAIRLCASCKGVMLTFMQRNGLTVDSSNWIASELCEDSHVVPSAQWQYHDSLTYELKVVVRVRT